MVRQASEDFSDIETGNNDRENLRPQRKPRSFKGAKAMACLSQTCGYERPGKLSVSALIIKPLSVLLMLGGHHRMLKNMFPTSTDLEKTSSSPGPHQLLSMPQ